jgi:CBS domain-containing protein
MRPTAPTAEPNDHAAAAAYLMKHVGATALVIVDPVTGQPASIITETGITHAVANGENLDEARIHDLMTTRPAGPRGTHAPFVDQMIHKE